MRRLKRLKRPKKKAPGPVEGLVLDAGTAFVGGLLVGFLFSKEGRAAIAPHLDGRTQRRWRKRARRRRKNRSVD